MSSTQLEKFELQAWGSNPSAGEMYGNDRQQCQVEVNILKQVWNDSTNYSRSTVNRTVAFDSCGPI